MFQWAARLRERLLQLLAQCLAERKSELDCTEDNGIPQVPRANGGTNADLESGGGGGGGNTGAIGLGDSGFGARRLLPSRVLKSLCGCAAYIAPNDFGFSIVNDGSDQHFLQAFMASVPSSPILEQTLEVMLNYYKLPEFNRPIIKLGPSALYGVQKSGNVRRMLLQPCSTRSKGPGTDSVLLFTRCRL